MNRLLFARDERDGYIIADHNDEKLAVIARAFLDKTVLSHLKQLLLNLDHLKEKYHVLTHGARYKFDLMKMDDNFILLGINDDQRPPDEDNPLVIDMNRQTLLDLIDQWHDLLKQNSSKEIMLTRQEDVFTLTDNPVHMPHEA